MDNFTAHQLHFTCEVQTPILLNEHQGSAIRGALFHALRNQFCFNKKVKDCGECAVWATCPFCFLVATRNPEGKRGVDVPRPYVIEPPLDGKTRYQPGDTLEFGLTMFAQALSFFPYVVLGSQALEQGGLGKKLRREDGRWRRGTFAIKKIGALNRLSGERQPVLHQGDTMVSVPGLPVTNEQVLARAAQLPRDRITLVFKTPTRIIERSKLQHHPTFRPLIQRLHRRLRDLTREFTDTPCYNPFDPIQDTERELDFRPVMAQAEAVQVVEDQTRWVELDSFSTRRSASTPMGGLVGQVTFEGALEPFLPWLVWGEIVHVGKDAVKGNGWYEIAFVST